MMRTLSDSEIQTIKDRLDSLKISYSEIYEELFDHYSTALEQLPAEQFTSEKKSLDEKFGWSIVRNMEKELLKNISHQLSTSQWKALRIWELDFTKVLGILLYLSLIILSYEFFGYDAALSLSFLPPLFMMVVLLYYAGLYFSLDRDYHRPRKVLIHAALRRYSLLFNLLNTLVIFSSFILNGSGMENLALVLWILYSGLLSVYALSLFAAIDLKALKIIGK